MGSQVIDGYGEIQFRHPTMGLFPGGYSDIELVPTVSIAEGKRFNLQGQSIVSDSRITLSKYELSIKTQTIDKRSFEMGFGEKAATSTSEIYYEMVEAMVPLEAPFTVDLGDTITDPDQVMVTMFEGGIWNITGGNRTGLALANVAGVPTTGQFSAVEAGDLTFNAAQAGAPVNISYPKEATNKQGLGFINNPVVFSGAPIYASMKLISDAFPDGFILICPSLSKISGMGLKSADVAEIEHRFTVGIAPGKRTPFQMLEL
jgi:hypothetical protein